MITIIAFHFQPLKNMCLHRVAGSCIPHRAQKRAIGDGGLAPGKVESIGTVMMKLEKYFMTYPMQNYVILIEYIDVQITGFFSSPAANIVRRPEKNRKRLGYDR